MKTILAILTLAALPAFCEAQRVTETVTSPAGVTRDVTPSTYYNADGSFKQIGQRPGPMPMPRPFPAPVVNYGVNREEVGKFGERYTVTGRPRPCDALDLRSVMAGDTNIPKDTGKPRVVVIGPAAEGKKICADIAASPMAPEVVVKTYTADGPESWAIKPMGLNVQPGGMCVFVESSEGKPLHLQRDYRDGIGGLMVAANKLKLGLRKPDPHFEAAKVPDLRKNPSPVPSIPGMENVNPIYLLLAAGGVLAAFLAYRHGQKGAQGQPVAASVSAPAPAPASPAKAAKPGLFAGFGVKKKASPGLASMFREHLDQQKASIEAAEKMLADVKAEREGCASALREMAGIETPKETPVAEAPKAA